MRDPIASTFSLLTQVHCALEATATGERREHHLRLMGDVFELARQFSRLRIVLAPLEPGWWLVGPEHAARALRSPGIGLRVAHAALAGAAPPAGDFTPGANAGRIVREALRNSATWAERVAQCRELASALLSLSVVGQPERVEYRPAPGAPIFLLSSRDFPAAREPATLDTITT